MVKRLKGAICYSLVVIMLMGSVRPVSIKGQEISQEKLPQVWVQNSSDRAFDSSTKPQYAEEVIQLYAAKNEYEAAQILVRADDIIKGLYLSVSDLTGDTGTILAESIDIYREYSAPAGVTGDIEATPDGSDSYTDALVHNVPTDVAANVTQPYWVRVYIPKNQPIGEYSGNVTVHSNSGNVQIPIRVMVYDVTIPDTNQSQFKMNNWFGSAGCDFGALESSVPSQYGVEMYDENWWKVMESFARDLAIHRNNVEFIDFQALLMPNSKIDADGNYQFDWSYFDRLVDIFIDAGALQYIYSPGSYITMDTDKTINIWTLQDENGAMVRALKPVYLDQKNGNVDPKIEEYMAILFGSLRVHMGERYPEYVDKFYFSSLDEPSDLEQIKGSNWFYNEVKKHYPEGRSNEAHSRFFNGLTESTTLCPVLDIYENNQSYYQEQKSAGRELWFYTCIGPQANYLNRFIPYHLVKTRLIPWYVYQIGGEGYLHWGYSWWRNSDTFDSKQTGDEWLVRPDKENFDVFTSVRHEAQLDGIEDFELLKILEQKDPEKAKEIADQLIQSATMYSKNGLSAQMAHKALLDAITGNEMEPIGIPVYQDTFSGKYDSAWIRNTGNWSITNDSYLFSGAGSNREGMSTLNGYQLKDGKIEVDIQIGNTYNRDDTMWGGVVFRKNNVSDTMWESGYTLLVRKNGEFQFLCGNPFKVLAEGKLNVTTGEKVRISISMNGEDITIYQAGKKTPILTIQDNAYTQGFVSLVSTGAEVNFDNFDLINFHGPMAPVDTTIIVDQSYRNSFTTSIKDFTTDGNVKIMNDGMLTTGSFTAGLIGRAFATAEYQFDMTYVGNQTVADKKDYWGGFSFGKGTSYRDIWMDGGYMLLFRSDQTLELMNQSGVVTSSEINIDMGQTIHVRAVKSATELSVYLNNEETPVIQTNIAPDLEGFFSLNGDGGTLKFQNLTISGVRDEGNLTVLDDFSGDLDKWTITQGAIPSAISIKEGILELYGVVEKKDTPNGIVGKGISPELVYKDTTFENVCYSLDLKINDVVQEENWAGIFFNSNGQQGFWKSGGYLLYLTNLNQIVLYKYGVGNLAVEELPVDITKELLNIQIKVLNGEISVFIDHAFAPIIQVVDHSFRSGYMGIMADFTDASYDNICVEQLEGTEQPGDNEPVQDEEFFDNFDGGTADNWKLVSSVDGNFVLKDQSLWLNGTNDAALLTLKEHVYKNMDIDFDMSIYTGNSWAGIALRRQTPYETIWNSGYFLYFDQSTGKLNLFKTNVGDVASYNIGTVNKDKVHFKVRMLENRIRVYINHELEPVIDYTDEQNTYSNGYIALASYMARAQYDNIVISKVKEDTESDIKIDESYLDGFSDTSNFSILNETNGVWNYADGVYSVDSVSSDYSQVSLRNYVYYDATISFDMRQRDEDKWSYCSFRRTAQTDGLWGSGYFMFYNEKDSWIKVYRTGANGGEIGVGTLPPNVSKNRHFEIVMKGNVFEVYVDGGEEAVLTCSDELGQYTEGYIALGVIDYAKADISNLTVVVPTATPTETPTAAPTATPTETPTPTSIPTPNPTEPPMDMQDYDVSVEGGRATVSIVLDKDNTNNLLPMAKILELLNDDEVCSVKVSIKLNQNGNLPSDIILSKEILNMAKKKGKSVEFEIRNEKDKEIYSWNISAEDLKYTKNEIVDIILNISVESAVASKSTSTALAKDKNNSQGVALKFNVVGALPCQAKVKIYIGNQAGLRLGKKVYFYSVNQKTEKFESVPNGSTYKIVKEGYITLNLLKGSDYVLLANYPSKKAVTTLTQQMIMPKKIIVNSGETTTIDVGLPVTMEKVKSFSNQVSNNAKGNVVVSYKINNSAIATIDKYGKLTAKKAGKTTITIKLKLYYGATKTFTTNVTVN
jgi:hypothetical protein